MKYSKADLIGEKQYLNSGEASWKYKLLFKWFPSKEINLALHLPESYLERAWLLCQDIERITEEEGLTPKILLNVLVRSFLLELAKKGSMPAYEYLLERYSKVLQIAHYQSDRVDEFELFDKPNEPLAKYQVTLDYDTIYRLEWFLKELHLLVDHTLSVEKVLEILFCYMIELVQKGNGAKFCRALIDYVNSVNE
ncbi:hypothetical protein [Bacillus sp. FJAT-45037]|uniref:hypothetical protein n=1 Tax=Bacillus sp. FJAT-45037 TaxID=2011007 RepID=UPI000C24444E|nr:hypothetical protein [Bacillus sp. FJAT-45037]